MLMVSVQPKFKTKTNAQTPTNLNESEINCPVNLSNEDSQYS